MGTVLGKRLAATPLEAVAASSRMERKREDFGKHPDLDRLQPTTCMVLHCVCHLQQDSGSQLASKARYAACD